MPRASSRLEGEGKRTFVFFGRLLSLKIAMIFFNGCQILDVVPFRLTRDSDLDVDEDDIDNFAEGSREISA